MMTLKRLSVALLALFATWYPNVAQSTGTLNDTGSLVQTFPAAGTHITPMSAETAGGFVFTASGGSRSGFRLQRYLPNGTLSATFAPGIDFRSIFTNNSGVLFAKEWGGHGHRIYSLTVGGAKTFLFSLSGAVLNSQAPADFNADDTELITMSKGTVNRYNATTGVFIGSFTLSGMTAAELSFPDSIQMETNLAGRIFTYSNGTVSEWNSSGARIGTSALPFGSNFFTDWSFGVSSDNLVFVFNIGSSRWESYDVGIEAQPDPIADAGPDQFVNEGVSVNLDGTSSSDPQGAPISHLWTQTGGPAVILDDNASPTPSFVAPFVATNQTITFELIVNNGFSDSAPVFVDITVLQVNNPPVADAGDDGTVKEGAATMLNGSMSFDPDGEPVVSYQWTQTAGPAVTLDDDTSAIPTFVAPTGTAGQSVTFDLVVSDGKEPSAPDAVTIDIVMNSAPVADAAADQTKDEGSLVTLDGTASSDPDIGDTISYSWNQTGGPAVTLDDNTLPMPSFDAPPVAGLTAFTFDLTVTDDDSPSGFNPKSDTDSVVINVVSINDPPSCELAVADNARLWPPNHKMVPVSIDGVMDEDPIFNMVTLTVTGVTQDEPINGTGDGDSSPDAMIVVGDPADSVMLRRERAGNANGRVYVVSFSATDGFEGCTGGVAVTVPHDRKGPDAVDDGQTVDSTLP